MEPQTPKTETQQTPVVKAPGVPSFAGQRSKTSKAVNPVKDTGIKKISKFFARLHSDRARIPLERDWAIVLILGAAILIGVFVWGIRLYYTISTGTFFKTINTSIVTEPVIINTELRQSIEGRIELQDERQQTLLSPTAVGDPSL
ncbi:hypothetical protein COB55_05475 [Candidatus Wolfebacteria bacterium]|nr:MAG: hypothetical protein COB55_05475 [Candidatus Wolfebacteria bacterium]